MIRRYLPKTTEDLIGWYERYISPVSLLVGFALDTIAVHALDLFFYSIVLLAHLSLAAGGIIALQLVETGRLKHKFALSVAKFIPVVVQFAFGALFSGFVILYSRSAAFALSWVFVVVLAALLLGNERFRRLYSEFHVQIGILFFALFSFTIFYVPMLIDSIGPKIFLLSGAVSLAVISAFLTLCYVLIPPLRRENKTRTARSIAVVFATINLLYFMGAVPPLPLALKDAGVFHSITRSENEYVVTFEPQKWYEVYTRYNTVFRRAPGEPVYVYTAIFAPSGISVGIEHEWQKYDEVTSEWVTESEFTFPVSGGREGGYRGYTLKRDITDGLWRVDVRTSFGQLIGRVGFEVVPVTERATVEEGRR